jgi:flagellar basal-body rod modification protein FlgD
MSTTSATLQGISALSNAAAGSSVSGASGDRSRLNANFDMFLQLMTTQLKNQSPDAPMNADQFTQQLVQYSSVEQQIKTNSLIEKMIAQSGAGGSTNAIGFLGTEITTRGSQANLANGSATWSFESNAAGVGKVTIRDQNGAVVRTIDRSVNKGTQSFQWDGKNDRGATMPDGRYSISVAGTSTSGSPLNIATDFTGRVTGIDMSGTEPVLEIGTARVKMSDVRSVRK